MAKKIIVSILKTWKGLIYLGYQKFLLRSLFQTLRQPIFEQVRTGIQEIIGELLSFGSTLQQQVTSFSCQNLLNQYLMVLTQLFLDCDLFAVLIELSVLDDTLKQLRSQEQLKQLSFLMYNLIPNCSKYTDFLLSSVHNDYSFIDLKGKCSSIVNCMSNYVFDTKMQTNSHSQLIYQCENFFHFTQLGLPSHRINNTQYIFQEGKVLGNVEQNKEFLQLLEKSYIHKENVKWNWTIIYEIIKKYFSLKWQELKGKFVKKLILYFHPNQQYFISLEWKQQNFIQAKVGYALIYNLLKIPDGALMLSVPQTDTICINRSFMGELYHILAIDNDQNVIHQAHHLLQPQEYSTKMIREYISWIGLFASFKYGQKLLKDAKIWETLELYVKYQQKDHILIHILFCLDYGKQGPSRSFLYFCLQNGSENLQKASLELLRLLYRSEFVDFFQYGIEILIQKMDSPTRELREKALSVIYEVIKDTDQMKQFLNLNPNLTDLCENDNPLLYIIMKTSQGFNYLQEKYNWIEKMVYKWESKLNEEYAEKLEKCLINQLNFNQQNQDLNSFIFPNMFNNSQSQFFAFGFIHRIPWILNILIVCEEFQQKNQYQIYIGYKGDQNVQYIVLTGYPLYNQNQQYIRFNQNFTVSLNLQIGKVIFFILFFFFVQKKYKKAFY
ncbi:rapamycin-insensitive companion of mtor, putative [Ichthyophthirius multifiliis]|uniref:Rapamycin-insensitive companion of mtor, putative n=1 Tax=Ichthyophthirius multifiliis TaxID=5932 RepID=G0QUZ5_ICHMU|nr:rapamycin-insensitive companion of mtor, putative [Ichthyophthirius multifiliis]EGR30964.1 rapamycin-insensitive companion of mtor, putative [Ichthyophthirius multifiliis]|eukprot:XP_004032551.1 rapamycin-insensitive companion of mtor, putative [Ichthyophthirius multifiliis]